MKNIWCCMQMLLVIEQIVFHLFFFVMLIQSIEKYLGIEILQNLTAYSVTTVKQYFTSLCGCI